MGNSLIVPETKYAETLMRGCLMASLDREGFYGLSALNQGS